MTTPALYGLLAEFDSPAALVGGIRAVRAEGYRRIEAYTPFPVESVAEELGYHRTAMPLVVLIGGIIGCVGGYFLQYWVATIAYPLNVGGRPFHSAPAFIPVTFELTILIAALFAVFGMLGLNGLPRPHHPLFNVPNFALATRDRFFLLIEARDPHFDRVRTRELVTRLLPREIAEVPF
ncbi:MAG TPA: DUF3341 domain-containing protein [Gemmataceae bacterium]|jgi:hypothetical protein|nr:DUF3341 domain-containing protein [Gemmataceae bacterium]